MSCSPLKLAMAIGTDDSRRSEFAAKNRSSGRSGQPRRDRVRDAIVGISWSDDADMICVTTTAGQKSRGTQSLAVERDVNGAGDPD